MSRSYSAPEAVLIVNAVCSSIALIEFGVCLTPEVCRDASIIRATVPLTTPAAMLVPLRRREALPPPSVGPRMSG